MNFSSRKYRVIHKRRGEGEPGPEPAGRAAVSPIDFDGNLWRFLLRRNKRRLQGTVNLKCGDSFSVSPLRILPVNSLKGVHLRLQTSTEVRMIFCEAAVLYWDLQCEGSQVISRPAFVSVLVSAGGVNRCELLFCISSRTLGLFESL